MGMDAFRLEAGLLGQSLEDEESARTAERPALGVEEELRAVAPVEIGPPAGKVPAQGFGCAASDWHDTLLSAFARAANEPLVQVDAPSLEPDRLADTKPCAVQQLDEG